MKKPPARKQKQQPGSATRTLLDIRPGQTIRCMYCDQIKLQTGSSGFHAHRVCRECVQKLQTTAKEKQ